MAVKGWAGGEAINDWDDVPDEIPPTAKGVYSVECVKAEAGTSSTGKPQVTLEVSLIERYEDGDAGMANPTAAKGKQREWLTVDPKSDFAKVKVKQAASAFGVELPGSTQFDAVEAFAASFVGQRSFAIFGEPKPNRDGKLFGNLLRFATQERAAEVLAGVQEGEAKEEGEQPRRRRRG